MDGGPKVRRRVEKSRGNEGDGTLLVPYVYRRGRVVGRVLEIDGMVAGIL